MIQVSEQIMYDAQMDKWELELEEHGESRSLAFGSLELAMQAQRKLRQEGAVYLSSPPKMTQDGEGDAPEPVFTPLDASRSVRLWFKRKDVTVLSGDLDVRGTGKKGRVRIGSTVYDVFGLACSLPNCRCDAYIRPVADSGAKEAAAA